MKKHNRKMKQSPSHLEMAKELLLSEQKGNPKNFKLVEIKNSLSDYDKERIKEAVLESAAKNTDYTPSELAKQLCETFIFIQTYTYLKPE